jgi:AmmeMemoRadiSam system protein B/AmmeMemoRadiSam system protein A
MFLFRRQSIVISTAVFLLASFLPLPAPAGDIRLPVVAGTWYPDSRSELAQMIDQLTVRAQKTELRLPPSKKLRALILPHAGFVYSGWTAAHAARVLTPGQFQKVVLLGPDHRVGFTNGAISDASAYQTPLGLIPLHSDSRQLRSESRLFQSSFASDRMEHSLEAVLPFLQVYLKEFTLVPIVLGPSNIAAIADAVDPLIDDNTLVVVSSDLSHFLPYPQAKKRDSQTIRLIANFKSQEISKRDNSACGKNPILVLLDLARRRHWTPVLLHYANSGDTGGGRSRVVGYASIAFFEGEPMPEKSQNDHHFNESQGRRLIQLARRTINDRLGIKPQEPASASQQDPLSEPCFQRHCGTFVTLKKNGALRGCIGNLIANKSVAEGIRDNALSAAFRDPRFPPLAPKEVDQLQISISILTQPKPLQYKDAADLLAKLRVNVDGVILRRGTAGATFLPQVWEQLPDPNDFLAHLCLKAGLQANTWRNTKLDVSTYQVQYFEEQK